MDESEGAITKAAEEEAETNTLASEQVELEIAQILEKINRFTQLVRFFFLLNPILPFLQGKNWENSKIKENPCIEFLGEWWWKKFWIILKNL